MSRNQLLRLALPAALLLLVAGLIIAVDHYARLPDTLSQHETLVYGQNRFVPGAQSALRLVVRDSRDGSPLPAADLRIALRPAAGGDAVTLFTGKSGPDGTADVTFTVPEDVAGDATLVVETSSSLGADRLERPVTVARDYRILLTTDKPIYQPGQLIHMRALALAAFDQQPAAGQKLELIVADAKGNKVFRRQLTTSEYGVAAVDFQLASEVNTGAYKLTATLGNTSSEKTVTVEHYVLPKFRVTLTTERPYYLPGEHVRGTLRAEYFYGKTVAGGTVKLEGYTFDVQRNVAVALEGITAEDGSYAFEFDLPSYMAGTELEGGQARFYLEASVTDLAAHGETANLSLPVSSSRIVIEAMPEGGQFRTDVENILYVLTSYPDGTPTEASLLISFENESIAVDTTTGPYGLAEVRVTPHSPWQSLQIIATDKAGASARRGFNFEGQWSEETVLLRPARAVVRVGETLTMTVLTSASQGTVYLDLVRAGQTMSTRAVTVSEGRAEVAVDLTPDLAGTLELHAYKILRSGTIVRDTRLVVVDMPAALNVSVTPGRDTYLPGDTAVLDLQVSGTDGAGTQAVLGLAIVDEAVFALAEQDPGFARLYFMLEQEILEPRIDLHGLSIPQVVTEPPAGDPAQRAARQGAAQAALAAALQPGAGFGLSANSHAEAIQRAEQQQAAFFRGLSDVLRLAVLLLPLVIAVLAFVAGRNAGQAWVWLLGLTGAYLVALVLFGVAVMNGGSLRGQDYAWILLGFLLVPLAYGVLALVSLRGPRRAYAVVAILIAAVMCCGPVMMVYGGVMPFGAMSAMPQAPRAGGWGEVMLEDKAMPAAAATAAPAAGAAPGAAPAEPRLRQYFPETMLWLPDATTDVNGTLHLDVPVADSITTWRITALASTRDGRLGSTIAGLRVFQDFFVDLDLPIALTVGDEIAVPVGVFNYLPDAQHVRLELAPAAWFESLDTATQELDIAGNDIGVVYFRVRALGFGMQAFKVTAYGSRMSDAIQREVRVYPNGKELRFTYADRLAAGTPVSQTVHVPAEAIAGTQALTVKIYPGMLSQVVEGLDSLLRMPSGCFEQTSSTTYPNVLVLDYLRVTDQASPEAQFKAEEYINLGYQRLTTFEVESTGGFSLFGNEPADRMLTAYGLQEFSDMSRVYDIDPALVERAAAWLLAQQAGDGSWENDRGLVHESTWQNLENDRVPVTAYIAWSLVDAGFAKDARTQKGIAYVREHAGQASDPYVVALAANALVADDLSRGNTISSGTKAMLDKLAALAVREGDGAIWPSGVATFMGAEGRSGSVETTALAALAFQRAGEHPDLANAALVSLVQQKDSFGTWHTTQATVLALKALIQSVRGGEPVDATVTIALNGGETRTVSVTPENFDVVQQVSFADMRPGADNIVTLSASGKGNLMYQVSGSYYVPWSAVPAAGPEGEAVTIDVAYDRTQIAVDDSVTVSVTVRLNEAGTAQSALIDLGLPPGFAVQAEDLAALVAHYSDMPKDYAGAKIERYELTGRQILVYVTNLSSDSALTFSYRLKAKFPLSAQTPASSAYDYYNPEVAGEMAPQLLTVVP